MKTIITAYNYKGYNIYLCDDDGDLYISILDENGKFVDSTPFHNDIESVKECAENIVDKYYWQTRFLKYNILTSLWKPLNTNLP